MEAGAGVAVLALKDRVGEASVQGKALIFIIFEKGKQAKTDVES